MKEFILGEYQMLDWSINHWSATYRACADNPKPPEKLLPQDKKRALALLEEAKVFCRKFEFNEALKIIGQVERDFHPDIQGFSPLFRDASTQLRMIGNSISEEFAMRKLAFIAPEKTKYFQRENLFGAEVSAAFPSSISDIHDAGNCLAAELYTAAVFHLMRTVEYGMRALAYHLKVSFKRKSIEAADWGNLITGIRNQIELRKLKYDASKRKKRGEGEMIKFYLVISDEMNVFKDVWRNSTMHTRSYYNESEADGVFIRVQDFMQRLAKGGISER